MVRQEKPLWRIFIGRSESMGGRALRRAVTRQELGYRIWERGMSREELLEGTEGQQMGLLLPFLGPLASDEEWTAETRLETARYYLQMARELGIGRAVFLLGESDGALAGLLAENNSADISCTAVLCRNGELYGAERPEDPAGFVEGLLESLARAARLRKKRVELPFREAVSCPLNFVDELGYLALYALLLYEKDDPLLLEPRVFTYGELARTAAGAAGFRGTLRFGRKELPQPPAATITARVTESGVRYKLPDIFSWLLLQRRRGGRITLSACVIMRDNEEDIGRCLGSLFAADEIIVVDTGSEDRSVEIARQYTDKVFHFKWNDDFSAAKNCALQHAKGDWILFPDSDEYFTEETALGLKRLCEDYTLPGGAQALMVRMVNIDLQGRQLAKSGEVAVRRFAVSGMHFSGRIHERMLTPEGRELTDCSVPAERAMMLHTGYAPERMEAKFRRNALLFQRALDSGEEVKYAAFYRARAGYMTYDWEAARHWGREAVKEVEHQSNLRFNAYRFWYQGCLHLGDEEGRREALQAMRRDMPLMPDSWAIEGTELWNEGREAEAAPFLLRALELVRDFRRLNPTENDEIGRDAPQLAEALAGYYEAQGDRQKARYCRSLVPEEQ